MPLPQKDWVMVENNLLLQEQLNYDIPELALEVEERREWFNKEQVAAFDGIMQLVTYDHGHTFFLHSAGGCGKTYVCNTIAAATCSMGKVALCVALSGIASLTSSSDLTSPLKISKLPNEASKVLNGMCQIIQTSNAHLLS